MTSAFVAIGSNLFVFIAGTYVLYEQIKRLRDRDNLQYLRYALVVGTILLLLASIASTTFQYCRVNNSCTQDSYLDLVTYVNAGARTIMIAMLTILYKNDGKCITGENQRNAKKN